MKLFDQFADWVAEKVASAYFFAFCATVVVAWLVLLPFEGWDNQLWHLALNSPTTGITFLMVALLENGQYRFERATNARLQEIIDKLDGAADPVEDEGQRA